MADTKRTHLPRIHSSLRELADFFEAKDKLIDGIELSSDLDFCPFRCFRAFGPVEPIPVFYGQDGQENFSVSKVSKRIEIYEHTSYYFNQSHTTNFLTGRPPLVPILISAP